MKKIKCMPYVMCCDNDTSHPDDDNYNGGGCYDGW